MNTGNGIRDMMKLVLSLLCAATVAVGCGGGGKTAPSSARRPQAGGLTTDISYLAFSLPEHVHWVRNEEPALEEDGVAEWYVEGSTLNTSPVRVMYQQLMPAESPIVVRDQVLTLLENCPDSKVGGLRTSSKYGNQLSFEATCSKFGEADFGLINFVSIFTDGAANHLVLAEVHTPASQKVGELNLKSAEDKQRAETSRRLADLMRNTMQTIRACNADDRCI